MQILVKYGQVNSFKLLCMDFVLSYRIEMEVAPGSNQVGRFPNFEVKIIIIVYSIPITSKFCINMDRLYNKNEGWKYRFLSKPQPNHNST